MNTNYLNDVNKFGMLMLTSAEMKMYLQLMIINYLLSHFSGKNTNVTLWYFYLSCIIII